jgi:uncharacterized protein (TIGR02265 family)
LKGYLSAYRQDGGDELYARCLELVGEKRLVDFFSYPYSSVMKVGVLGAEVLGPKHGGVRPYLRAMGRIAVDEYLGSALGKTFMSLVRPTPKSMLSSLPTAIRTIMSFGDRTFEMTGPASCVCKCRQDFSPSEANAGAIEAVVKATGVSGVEVGVEQMGLLDYDITAKWSA